MLVKTRGLVFKSFKYRDTSIIVKVLTEQLGVQTYIVNGIRSKRANSKIALYQPLTFLDLVVYFKPNTDIHRISEARCQEPYQTIPYDIKKSAIAVFLAEVLYKCIKEEEECVALFDFIHSSIFTLDLSDAGYEDFHLQFLYNLSNYLGFGMNDSDNLLEESTMALLSAPYDKKNKMTGHERRATLSHIIDFYKTHIDGFGSLHSLQVLREVLA